MPSFVFFSTALLALATRILAAAPTISSPNVYQCTPATSYQITCDEPPCQVVARPANDPSQSVAIIGTVQAAGASSLPWRASVPAGTEITVYITDVNGLTGNNSPTVVAAGTGDCSSAGSSSSPSSSTSATSSAVSSESSSSLSASGSSSASSASSSASSASTSASASSISSESSTTTAMSKPQISSTASGTT
ncbi:uncharacterized protein JCM15063_001223 [Sporobolomyces koalae]|uniref:uncharacterized protein n=1 Tax=Sporobolomyces koalae TaxID=500713 RepID=UPI003178F908